MIALGYSTPRILYKQSWRLWLFYCWSKHTNSCNTDGWTGFRICGLEIEWGPNHDEGLG